LKRLTTRQMAEFVARGVLRFDAVVPASVNEAFIEEAYRGEVPVVAAGVPLAEVYPEGSALREVYALPVVEGAIHSLVGPNPVFDHHFLHQAFGPSLFEKLGVEQQSQPYHQDSTIDPRRSFDIQVFYFPHETSRENGGTRYLPGSHLRLVSEFAIARYQNLLGQEHVHCPAGSIFIFHHGLWHGGGLNRREDARIMIKTRVAASGSQSRHWDTSDLGNGDEQLRQRPIFWVKDSLDPDHIHSILCRPEPWYELDSMRLEFVNRVKLWRYLLGDERADVDYWLTRLENENG